MKKDDLKYSINKRLSGLPAGLSSGDFAFLLKSDFSISSEVFERDRALKMTESETIPVERLKVYALMFQVEEEDLLTGVTSDAKKNPFPRKGKGI